MITKNVSLRHIYTHAPNRSQIFSDGNFPIGFFLSNIRLKCNVTTLQLFKKVTRTSIRYSSEDATTKFL
jgi:hypothetical protein